MNARVETTEAFYERVCFSKRSYSSLRKAYLARATILRHPESRAYGRVIGCRAYKCSICGEFHLGHSSLEKKAEHAEAIR